MEKQDKKRTLYFDAVRVIACLMVIAFHAPMDKASAGDGPFLVAQGFFCGAGVPLFFMVSGALLLSRPIKESAFQYLKKRITKVLFPTIIFSVLFITLKTTDFWGGHPFLKPLLSLPFKYDSPVLWFMYSLIGLYLLIPILSPWLERVSKGELKFYLGLWGVTLCFPLLGHYLDVDTSTMGISYYFTGYAGYFILGLYASKNDVSMKLLIGIIAVSLSSLCIIKMFHLDVPTDVVVNYLSLPIAAYSLAIFNFCKRYSNRIGKKLTKIIEFVSPLCFGVYLIHIFVRFFLIDFCDFIIGISNFYLQYLVSFLLTFFSSLLMAYLISLLPAGKYIIGYTRKK